MPKKIDKNKTKLRNRFLTEASEEIIASKKLNKQNKVDPKDRPGGG